MLKSHGAAGTKLYSAANTQIKKLCLEHNLPLPAYDWVLKCCHTFNLLDARGVISATERMAYILRVRSMVKECCASYIATVVGDDQGDQNEKGE